MRLWRGGRVLTPSRRLVAGIFLFQDLFEMRQLFFPRQLVRLLCLFLGCQLLVMFHDGRFLVRAGMRDVLLGFHSPVIYKRMNEISYTQKPQCTLAKPIPEMGETL